MSDLTKKALDASLKHLLEEKPLHKITISDIAEDCGISRMTFYYHFKDLYDLVEWSIMEDAQSALQGKKTYQTWDQGFLQIFESLQKKKTFVINVYHSVSREQIEQYLFAVTYKLLIDVVNEKAEAIPVREEDKIFIANFYKYGFVGLVLEWIQNDMKEEPKVIIERLKNLIQGDVEKALENHRTDK